MAASQVNSLLAVTLAHSKVKVAFSVDAELIRALGRTSRERRQPRSRLVEEAPRLWRRRQLEESLREGKGDARLSPRPSPCRGRGSRCGSLAPEGLAIAHWAADQSPRTRRRLGCWGRVPSEPTIRRVLGALDGQALDARVGAWLAQHTTLAGQGLAIDGKTLRGSADGATKAVHLVSAVLHRDGVVVAQHRVPDKTNQITSVEPLFAERNITGTVVTGDALFAQKAIATHLVQGKQADSLFTVKDNHPTLRQDISDLQLDAFPPSAPHG